MLMTTWYAQIDRARSVAETLSVARDYVATLTPEELALLPAECRPGRIRDAKDIEDLHATLVDVYRASRATGEALDVLQRLTSLYVRLVIRLSELGGNSREPNGGNDGNPSLGDPKSAAPLGRRRPAGSSRAGPSSSTTTSAPGFPPGARRREPERPPGTRWTRTAATPVPSRSSTVAAGLACPSRSRSACRSRAGPPTA